jgi:nucleoside-diphosphate-sugar epimerase
LHAAKIGRYPDDRRIASIYAALARAKLRWEPKVDLRDGLKRTIDYFTSIL